MAGEDASGAAGAVVVRVREPNPQPNPQPRPKPQQHSLIRLRHKLLRERQWFKGSQQ
jgi:hypothetical protein